VGAILTIAFVTACGGSTPAVAPARPTAVAAPAPPVHTPEFAAGIAAFDQGDYVGAKASFEAAFKGNPQDYEALWNLGQACEKLGDNQGAATAYRAEIAMKPDADRAFAELATLYVAEGNTDKALATASEGLANRPGSAVLHGAMGLALATRGDKDTAMQQFVQAIQLDGRDPNLEYLLAVWLNRWHERGAAAHLDLALPLVQNDYAMVVSIGHEYRMAGEFDSCVRTLSTAIQARDGGEARTERALCKLGLKDEAAALSDLKNAVTVEPNYPQAHFFLAGRLAGSKHYREAAEEYAIYLRLAPEGSLAEQASVRLAAAQDAAAHEKDATASKKKAR
jgi:Tfp pilus assembly protein PilF